MSGRWKAGSWQDEVVKGFSRLFSRNPAHARQPKDRERPEPSQEAGSLHAESGEERDSPSQEPFQVSQSVDESSGDREEHSRSQELTSTDSPSVTPNVKSSDSDKQPKDPFLQFFGQLFNFTSKSELNQESKASALKDDDGKAEEDFQDQSSPEGGEHMDLEQAKGLRNIHTGTDTEAAASRKAVSSNSLTPASSQETEEGSEPEITDAQTQIEYKESAPSITYATYRGSRQIRKLLRRRAHVETTIPEREEVPVPDNFIVTKNGNIEEVTLSNAETEGHLSEKESRDGAEPEWRRTDGKQHASNNLEPLQSKHVPVYNQICFPESKLLSETNSQIATSSSSQDIFTFKMNAMNNKLDEKESTADRLMEMGFQPVANISGLEKVTNSHFEASNQELTQNEFKPVCSRKKYINENLRLKDSLCSNQITGQSEFQTGTPIFQEDNVLQMHTTPETFMENGSENRFLNIVEMEQTVRVNEKAQKMQACKLEIGFVSHELTSSDGEISRAFDDFDASKGSRHRPENLRQTKAFEYKSENTKNIYPHVKELQRANAAEISQGLGDINQVKVSCPALKIDNAPTTKVSAELETSKNNPLPLVQMTVETIPCITSMDINNTQHLSETAHVNVAENLLLICRPSDGHWTQSSAPDFPCNIDHANMPMLPSAFDCSSMDKTSALTSKINHTSSACPSVYDPEAEISPPTPLSEAAAEILAPMLLSEGDTVAKISPPIPLSESNEVVEISTPTSSSENNEVAKTSPSTPPSKNNEVAKISPPTPSSKNNEVAKVSSPTPTSENNEVATISPSKPSSENNEVVEISPPTPSSENNEVANVSPPTPTSENNEVVKISPPTPSFENNEVVEISPPTLSSESNEVVQISPPTPSSESNEVVEICPPTPSSERNVVLEICPPTPSSENNEVVHISPPTLSSESNVVVQISPPTPSSESNEVVEISPSTPLSESHAVVQISPSSLLSECDEVVKISPPIPLSEGNEVVQISLPSSLSEGDEVVNISLPTPLSEVDEVVEISPPIPLSVIIKTSPLSPLSEGNDVAGITHLASAPNSVSMDKLLPPVFSLRDVSVAKVSVKSVDINKVKILAHSLDPEVIHVSKIAPSALEPEYICVANCSPNESLDTVVTKISSLTLDTGNVTMINTSAPAFLNDSVHRVNVSPSSVTNADDHSLTFTPSKFPGINVDMIVAESEDNNEDTLASSVKFKTISPANICPNSFESTVGSMTTTYIPPLKLEGGNQAKIESPASVSKNVRMDTESLDASAVKSSSTLGIKDAIIVEPSSSDICHSECVENMSPGTKLTNNSGNDKYMNCAEIEARESASISNAGCSPCQLNPVFSEIEPSFVSSKVRKIVDHSTSVDVSYILLNKVDKIVCDILCSAIEDIKVNRATRTYQLYDKMAPSIQSNNFNGKSDEIILFKSKAGESDKIPEQCFEKNCIENPLPVDGNETFHGERHTDAEGENRSFSTTEKIDMRDLFTLKAEEVINVVINLAKQKVISEQLELNFDKTHNMNVVLTSHTGMTEGPEATPRLKAEDFINEPPKAKISKSSEQLNDLFRISEATNYSAPLSLQRVMNCTDTTQKTGETEQNSMPLISKNGFMHADKDTAVGWNPAGISKDLPTRNTNEAEIIRDKGNESRFVASTGRPETMLTVHGVNRITAEKLQMLQRELSSEKNDLETLPIREGDMASENLLTEVSDNVYPSNDMQEGWKCWRLSYNDWPFSKLSFALQGKDTVEDEEQTEATEEHDLFTSKLPATRFPHYEEMESENNRGYDCKENDERPETCDADNPDSFLAIQAKRFRIYPFSLSPIYEDDSSQEDLISSCDSPGYTSEKSMVNNANQASSVLSLLQSVSDRLKHSNRLHEEEEESCEKKLPLQDEVYQTCEWTDYIMDKSPISSADSSLSNRQRDKCLKKSPGLVLTDSSKSVYETDGGPISSSVSRSVYYQYLQSAKTYSFEKEAKFGSIFEEMLLPKDPAEEDFLKTSLLVNHIDREGLKCNPRPGKMVIYNVDGSKSKLEICSDVLDATSWTFPNGTLIRVVRGCWILYDKPKFQGQTYVLEEGEVVLTDLWDFHSRTLDPSNIVIGSVRRVQKDSEVPEVEIIPQIGLEDAPICVQSEIARLIDSQINVKTGIWLAYSDCHYEGHASVLEVGQPSSLSAEANVKSLRPLRMGGLKVQMPTDPHMIIYEKGNFGGRSHELTEHLFALSDLLNTEQEFHSIGSIRVTGGVWVAYEEERYKGHQYLLEEGEYEDWQAWSGSGSILGSFRYIQADFLEPSVTLFELDTDGKKIDVNQDIPDLEEAGYGLVTRSIHVRNGMWVAYQQKHYSGKQYVLEKGRYKSCLDWGASSNTILSIRPVRLEPLGRQEPPHLLKAYSDKNFQGTCVDITAEISDFTSPGSIKVLRGCWLLGYKWEMADCCCVLEEGHYPSLASCGCPTADIKFLQPVEHVFAEPSISLFALDSCEGRELHFEDAAHSVLNKDLYFYTQSIRVESGLWIMYEGANFLGRQVLLEPCEIPNWMEFSGWKAVGSLRPVNQYTVYFRMKNQAEEKYLTVTGKLMDVRASSVCLSAWNGKDTQIWYYRRGLIKSKVTGACLDVIGGRDVPGSKVALWNEHGKSRQKWKFHKDGTISCYLNDQLLLDVKGGKYYDKNHIVVNHPQEGELLQKWAVEIL